VNRRIPKLFTGQREEYDPCLMAGTVSARMPSAQCKVWLEFLLTTAPTQKNRELLSDYFFNQFTRSSESLYNFLQFLHAYLRSERSAKLKKHSASQYLSILSPLCERFGLFEEKNVMDTDCFRIVDPKNYRSTETMLSQYKVKSQTVIAGISAALATLLEEHRFHCDLQGRYKNLYSIYGKLQRKSYTHALELRDIFAFRIVLTDNRMEECFEVLNLLHDRFHPVADCFKDYISIPKINGYQSLHTILNNVIPDLDLPIEVQIRTQSMHEFAERGFASHWLYAREKQAPSMTEKEQKLITHFLSLSENAQREEVLVCFSPKGDLVKLVPGSTVIDFAYHIHTDLGNRALAAKINGKPKNIYYRIHEGDRVQVLRGRTNQVKKEWLAHAFLPSTRRKIYEYTRS
jgi:GTP pyrophosphokinase/guanosine-3',5'-bis(diphosphate) 3'-pyrophosphohydrolase